MLYEIRNLKQIFDGKKILDIDSVSISKGKIYSLSGPNGAGKTTLLKILSFLEKPSSGEIIYTGTPVKWNAGGLVNLRRKVVMLDQHPIMFTTSVLKNVEFGLKIRKIERKKRLQIVEEALELVGMKDFINERADTLSGGETQRVALARVIAVKPEVLICDEPVSNVDIENQSAIMRILKEINSQEKITVIFTSHDRLQALSIADDTLFLDRGLILKHSGDNHFSVDFTEINSDKFCVINSSLSFRFPFDIKGRSRITIDPEKIEISPKEGDIKGVIVQTGIENDMVRVVVNAGTNISVLVKDSCPDLKSFVPGRDVHLKIPCESVKIIK